jgi:hypothetical protein
MILELHSILTECDPRKPEPLPGYEYAGPAQYLTSIPEEAQCFKSDLDALRLHEGQ